MFEQSDQSPFRCLFMDENVVCQRLKRRTQPRPLMGLSDISVGSSQRSMKTTCVTQKSSEMERTESRREAPGSAGLCF